MYDVGNLFFVVAQASVSALALASVSVSGPLLVGNGNQCFAGGEGWQWRIDGQDTVLAEGRANRLGIDALGQQELPVVLPVDALCVRLLLVLGVHLEIQERTFS